jgi:hypothetical protein
LSFCPNNFSTQEVPPKAQLCLFLQTPAGFWQISWHAPGETLIRGITWWINFLRNVKVTLVDPQIDSTTVGISKQETQTPTHPTTSTSSTLNNSSEHH